MFEIESYFDLVLGTMLIGDAEVVLFLNGAVFGVLLTPVASKWISKDLI